MELSEEDKVIAISRYRVEKLVKDALVRQRKEHGDLITRHRDELAEIEKICAEVGHDYHNGYGFTDYCRWCGARKPTRKG